MKKYSMILLSILFCILLTGCSCQHEWADATCTAAKTCTLCNMVEGEALGHSWQEADCTTPKTCSRCALEEGSPLGHKWQDADCTTPKTCTVCAVTDGQPLEHVWDSEATLYTAPFCSVCGTEGQPLPGYFAQNDLLLNVYPGQAADYTTNTLVRPDLDTTCLFLVSEMEVFDYNPTHRIRPGYEWRHVDISIALSDNHALLYSSNVTFARADYYQDQELTQAKKQESFTVTFHDTEYQCRAFYDNRGYRFEGSDIVLDLTVHVQVPIGYDGVVLAFHHGSIAVDGMHLHEVEDENMLLLRLA